MTRSAIEQLELNIQEAKKTLALGQALERLKQNSDFKLVVREGYFEKEAIRLVHLKAHPNMNSADAQASIIRDMDAIGALSGYFETIRHLANQAGKQLVDDEETREDLAREELEA